MTDIIIIGGGPAGLTAGIYASRSGLDVLLYEGAVPGGQMANTSWVENYPGAEPAAGFEIAMKMEQQAIDSGVKIKYENVTAITRTAEGFTVTAETGEQARAVILCSGARPRPLGIADEARYLGKGVSYCATCDGALFRGQPVAVIGGGNAAVEEAVYLSKIASEVFLIHRRNELRADAAGQAELDTSGVKSVLNSVVESLAGADKVHTLSVRNVETNEKNVIPAEGVFVAIGREPNNALIKDMVELDEGGFIKVDAHMRTNIPHLYAAGDIRSKDLRQIVTATADGAIAADAARRDLFG